MDEDALAKPTVLAPPTGARVRRELAYHVDALGELRLDAYRPARGEGPWPAVFLVNGDADEAVIARAKDWGVFRSYGEHLAARRLVGIPFNHRSTRTLSRTEVAAEVAAAVAYARGHASELAIDPDRVGVWAFSAAGAFALAPLLRERPRYLRAVAGFYTVWDLAPFRASSSAPSEETIRQWSATAALGDSGEGLPPIFIGVADRDTAPLMTGAERFIARAHELGVDVRVHHHESGRHGFDTLDDDERSRTLITAALEFFAAELRR